MFFGNIIKLYYVALQGLITFLVNENGFNSDRVTKVSSLVLFWIALVRFQLPLQENSNDLHMNVRQ